VHTPRNQLHQPWGFLAVGNQDLPPAELRVVKSMDFSHAPLQVPKVVLNRFQLPLTRKYTVLEKTLGIIEGNNTQFRKKTVTWVFVKELLTESLRTNLGLIPEGHGSRFTPGRLILTKRNQNNVETTKR
jgi:hypothetical protein